MRAQYTKNPLIQSEKFNQLKHQKLESISMEPKKVAAYEENPKVFVNSLLEPKKMQSKKRKKVLMGSSVFLNVESQSKLCNPEEVLDSSMHN